MTSVPMRLAILTLCLHLLASLHAAEPRDTMPDTWSATDALGRALPMSRDSPANGTSATDSQLMSSS